MFISSCNFCKTSANCIKTLGGLKYSRTVRITQASNHVCSCNILLLSLFPFREDEKLIFHILYLTDGAFRSKTTTTAKSKQTNRLASNSMNKTKYVDDTTVIQFVPRLLPQTWILLFQISTLVFCTTHLLNVRSVELENPSWRENSWANLKFNLRTSWWKLFWSSFCPRKANISVSVEKAEVSLLNFDMLLYH